MFTYLKALRIAAIAHRGQRDKAGKAYLWHPIKVSQGVHTREAKIVALLHDVLEDSDYTLEDLVFLSSKQKQALVLLTHERGEPYFDYIVKIKANPLARAVKLSDLKQNSDLNRLKVVTEKDEQRRIKYQKAIGILEN